MSSPIRFVQRGSLDHAEQYMKNLLKLDIKAIAAAQAQLGVQALIDATPVDSGVAAHSWSYRISQNRGGISIEWINTDIENGFPVVIMLQYGHATGTGGYVQGRDFINPAIRPVFDRIATEVWKAVTSA